MSWQCPSFETYMSRECAYADWEICQQCRARVRDEVLLRAWVLVGLGNSIA